jgi:hypothetical protein
MMPFVREQLGTEFVGWVSRSAHVRAAERGEIRPIGALEPANAATLDAMRAVVDSTAKDWITYQRQAVESTFATPPPGQTTVPGVIWPIRSTRISCTASVRWPGRASSRPACPERRPVGSG